MYVKNYTRSYTLLSLIILFGALLSASSVDAATITFRPQVGSYVVGDKVSVKILVNSDGKSINAVAALVKYPSDVLTLTSISKSGSIINIWAQEPSYSNSAGTANLEGVILNGYTGSSGTVATLVFKVKASGTASIFYKTASILANDGNGTDILTDKQTATFTTTTAVPPKIKDTTVVADKKPVKDTTIVIGEIKNVNPSDVKKSFLLSSPQPVKDDTYAVTIDTLESVSFVDDGSHVFTAGSLSNGPHTIKVTASDPVGATLSGTLSFSTLSLKVPVITYYPALMYIDQFMVLKGLADPLVDVELTITNTNTGTVAIEHVQTNTDGKFTFVPDQKMIAGTYSIIGRATNKDGIVSDYMQSVQVVNKEYPINKFVSEFSKYLTLLTPLIALAALAALAMIYGFYHVKKAHLYLSKKLSSTEDIVTKSFDLLAEDVDEEISIFRKIKTNKPLSKEEQVFLGKFKKDIRAAEKIIKDEVKNVQTKS